MNEINAAGFEGTFDFLYLPLDQKLGRSRGYAYIQFRTADDAERFREQFDNRYVGGRHSGLTSQVVVSPKTVQVVLAEAGRVNIPGDGPWMSD